MSICVSRRRSKLLVNVATLSMVAIIGAGCSTDFSRLDDPFVTASVPTENQRAIIRKDAEKDQPYPGDIDKRTTASIGNPRATSYAARSSTDAPQPYPGDVVTRSPLPNSKQVRSATLKRTDRLKPVSLLPETLPEGQNETVRPASPPAAKRKRRFLAEPQKKPAKPVISAPEPVSRKTAPTRSTNTGLAKVGGTQVRLRKGQTLYDLSRRYGVLVKDIMRVNNISNAGDIVAGQRVFIPANPRSALTANTGQRTRDLRSSRLNSPNVNSDEKPSQRIAVPTIKVTRIASAKPIAKSVDRKVKSSIEISETNPGNQYVVASGDTVGGIARRNNITKSALRKANGFSGNAIRVGQRLVIPKPGKSGNIRVVSLKRPKTEMAVDPFVTGTPSATARKNPRKFKNNTGPAAYTPPQKSAELAKRASIKAVTPNQTGLANFRWPARGRVVSKFGSKVNGAPNDGIDISVPVGTAVKAAENGTVIYSGNELEEFGKLILVRHSGGWVSAYAYSSKNLVSRGDQVKRGQTIARSGRSGIATTPKIHFELRKDSNPVNPVKHLKRG